VRCSRCDLIITSLCSASYTSCQRGTARALAAERRAATPCCCRAPGGRRCRSISSAHTALSSKPAARRGCGPMMRQTDGRTLDRFIDLLLILCEQCPVRQLGLKLAHRTTTSCLLYCPHSLLNSRGYDSPACREIRGSRTPSYYIIRQIYGQILTMNIRLYTLHLVVAPSQVHQLGLNSLGFNSVTAEEI